jgi:septum formation protein
MNNMSHITHHTPLVLASGSAIRAQMLKGAGLQFSVAPSNVDEDEIKREIGDVPKEALAAELARAKALNVSPAYPEHLCIGADQLCVQKNRIFDKPETRKAAIEQLHQLQAHEHCQISAVCITRGGEVVWEHQECATLTMRALTDAEITAYITADDPLKSCGAYKYESLGKHLFERVDGNDSVIKGLPLQALIAKLHKMGAIALSA